MGQNPGEIYKGNPLYQRQLEFYDIYKTKSADIVMLGNSITHGVDWSELLGRKNIVNRGISSDIVEGFYNRLNYVYELNPKICFILGGINDIYNWIPVADIFESYKKVIMKLKEHNITPVIQSTIYAGKGWPQSADRNNEVEKLNKLLREYASKNGMEFIDLNSFLSKDKYLIDKYTWDGLHLNAEGYKLWGNEINQALVKHGL